jgi:hypothetical protein
MAFKKPKQGGFSDELWQSKECQEYVTRSISFAYYGANSRTEEFDKAVEKFLRAEGMTASEAALCLTGGSFRHFMDKITKTTPLEMFESELKSRYSGVLKDLHTWPQFFERTYHVQVVEHGSRSYTVKAESAKEAKERALAMFAEDLNEAEETWSEACVLKVVRTPLKK